MKAEQRYDLIVEADWGLCPLIRQVSDCCLVHLGDAMPRGGLNDILMPRFHYATVRGVMIEVGAVVKHQGHYWFRLKHLS